MTAPRKLTQEEYGRIGARRRWGEPRIVRLDSLDADTRRLVTALVQADRAAKAAKAESDS